MTIGEYLIARPEAAPLLAHLKIDFCCGGHRDLDEVLGQSGLDPTTFSVLTSAFWGFPQGEPLSKEHPALLETPDLIDYIVATHHRFLREQLPVLQEKATKVLVAHGHRDPALEKLRKSLDSLAQDLLAHLQQEEDEVFPVLRSGIPLPQPLGASLAQDHRSAGEVLETIRSTTRDFAVPDWACTTYRSLMEGLDALESDLHLHIHLENNVLFIRTGDEGESYKGTTGTKGRPNRHRPLVPAAREFRPVAASPQSEPGL